MPDSSEEDAREAAALIEQIRVAEARLAIGRAISERDDVPEYYLIQGRIELVAGAKENAFIAFKNALDLDATNPIALQQVARLGLEVGRFRDALKAVETTLVLDPRNQDALIIRGLIHLVQDDYEEALDFAERLRRIDRFHEGGIILEARAKLLLGQPEDALRLISEFEEEKGATPGSARNRVEIGRYLAEAEEMERGFRYLVEETPDDINVRVDYANFLMKRGERPAAIRQLTAAITKQDIAQPDVEAALAIVREYEAEAELQNSLSSGRPDLAAPTRVKVARLLIDADLTAAAKEMLGQTSKPDAEATRGWLEFKSGNAEQAEQIAQSVLAEDAENCVAFFVSANVDLAAGRSRDAIRKGQQSAAQCPEEKQAWTVTARAFAQIEDFANARRVFRDGIDALPQDTGMTTAYAEWLSTNGAGREAVAAARKLTQNAPALVSGWRLYKRVCEQQNAACAQRAARGLTNAEKIYAVDFKPGERPANDLLGRLERR